MSKWPPVSIVIDAEHEATLNIGGFTQTLQCENLTHARKTMQILLTKWATYLPPETEVHITDPEDSWSMQLTKDGKLGNTETLEKPVKNPWWKRGSK